MQGSSSHLASPSDIARLLPLCRLPWSDIGDSRLIWTVFCRKFYYWTQPNPTHSNPYMGPTLFGPSFSGPPFSAHLTYKRLDPGSSWWINFRKFSMQLHELSLTLESTIGSWHTVHRKTWAKLVRHPWTYSVPNFSHCSSLSEWTGTAPAYLTELCIPITQSRSSCRLRSSYRNRLAVPSVKLSIGSRSFSVSGPTVWLYLIILEIPPFPLMSSNVI